MLDELTAETFFNLIVPGDTIIDFYPQSSTWAEKILSENPEIKFHLITENSSLLNNLYPYILKGKLIPGEIASSIENYLKEHRIKNIFLVRVNFTFFQRPGDDGENELTLNPTRIKGFKDEQDSVGRRDLKNVFLPSLSKRGAGGELFQNGASHLSELLSLRVADFILLENISENELPADSFYHSFKISENTFLLISSRYYEQLEEIKSYSSGLEKTALKYNIYPKGLIHTGNFLPFKLRTYFKSGVKKFLLIKTELKEPEKYLPFPLKNRSITVKDSGTRIIILEKNPRLTGHSRITEEEIETIEALYSESDYRDYNVMELEEAFNDYITNDLIIQEQDAIKFTGIPAGYREMYNSILLSKGFINTGNSIYIKEPLITMSSLGLNGRFGNQVFQYAFLKIYAKEHNIKTETGFWPGRFLFGHDEPLISGKLPVVNEKTDGIKEPSPAFRINSDKPLYNTDITGFFQYHTSFYRPYREYFRSLFIPHEKIKVKMDYFLKKLQTGNRTIIAFHLRRGDYTGLSGLFTAPSQWYKAWLEENWDTFKNPVLFIASDESEKVMEEFSEYNPVTAAGLGMQLPAVTFYPDFYILSKCDVLAISDSSFSFAAALLNENAKTFLRPHPEFKKLVPFEPWDSDVLLRGENNSPINPLSPD